MSKSMEKALFNLRFAAKDLDRNAKKCDKAEVLEKGKLKKCIQRGDMESAKIHAENAIRQKNQSLNYRRMSARVDAVAARVQTALTTQNVTKSMGTVVRSMESAMRSMNLEKISQLMDKFEQQFENLDVQTQVMDDTMGATSTLTAPQAQVDSLMQEVADESGLELNMQLPASQTATVGASTASKEQDDLTDRLAKLRQM